MKPYQSALITSKTVRLKEMVFGAQNQHRSHTLVHTIIKTGTTATIIIKTSTTAPIRWYT